MCLRNKPLFIKYVSENRLEDNNEYTENVIVERITPDDDPYVEEYHHEVTNEVGKAMLISQFLFFKKI